MPISHELSDSFRIPESWKDWELQTKAENFNDLLFLESSRAFIPRDSKVLEIGPGATFWEDGKFAMPMSPGPVLLPLYLEQGEKSRFDIIDLPSDEVRGGSHNLGVVRNTLQMILDSTGKPYVLNDAIIADVLTYKSEIEYDVLFDHRTSYDWLFQQTYDAPKTELSHPGYIARQMGNLLSPTGRWLMFAQYKEASNGSFETGKTRKLTALLNGIQEAGLRIQALKRIASERRSDCPTVPEEFEKSHNRLFRHGSYIIQNSKYLTRGGADCLVVVSH